MVSALSSDDLVPAKTPSSRNHAWYNQLRQSSCLTDETKEGETHNITLPREEVERMKEVLLRRQGLRHSSYQSSLMMALTNATQCTYCHITLNVEVLSELSVTAGSAAYAAEQRKHIANDQVGFVSTLL